MERFGPIARGMHREWTAIDELVAFGRARWPDEDWSRFARTEHAAPFGESDRVPFYLGRVLFAEGPGLRESA